MPISYSWEMTIISNTNEMDNTAENTFFQGFLLS